MYRLKPKRPYKNLLEFRHKRFFRKPTERLAKNPDKWPCLVCEGRGWGYDPRDPPDVIEGNKHRNTLRCKACGGTGCGPRKAVAEAYRITIARWKAEFADYRHLVTARKEALAKLTDEEIRAFRELGV